MSKKKLLRCGACGDFVNISSLRELQAYTEKEKQEAELVHCGCENQEEIRCVTRDMAIDAGDLSLEGQII
jgi:hypothetical protein